MYFLNKKPVAALIMSLVILASLILIAQAPVSEALVFWGILLTVCILVDFVVGAKALTKMQSRLAAIAIGLVAIAGFVLFGVVVKATMPNTDVASSRNQSAGQNAESPTNTVPEITAGNGKQADEMYELGLLYYGRGEYAKAIQTLDKVKETSDYYVDAVKLRAEAADCYRSSLTDTAKTYVDEGDYKLAIEILNGGLAVISDDIQLRKTIEDYSLAYKNVVRSEAIEDAEIAASNLDYPSALISIKNAIDEIENDVELDALKQKYSTEYKDYALVRANEIFYSEGYEAAVQLLRETQKHLPIDADIAHAIEEYQTYAPMYLIEDIDYLTKTGSTYGGTRLEIGNDALIDNDGNTIMWLSR